MLLAHKIEIYPTATQILYLERSFGSRRHCFNQLLAHFNQPEVKWSKKAAVQVYIELRRQYPWYAEVSQRVTRNAIDDLDNAYKHFFRRVKIGGTPGYPNFKKKGVNDSFALREKPKFDVDGRWLRIERLATKIKLSQPVRFFGTCNQVTISKQAGKYYASVLVNTLDYVKTAGVGSVGVDLGIKDLATFSDGVVTPANQHLKKNLRKLKKAQRRLSKKRKGSNRRAKAKLRVARLHKRVTDQRKACLHDLTDKLTATYHTICIEDLNVKGMVQNRKLARCISDAGFGMFRQFLQYKAALRGNQVVVVDRFFPSSKTCSACGNVKEMPLAERTYVCDSCGISIDRDLNAAINILTYGEDTLRPTEKRTQELSQTVSNNGISVDGVNEIIADCVDLAIL
jgi:putative transposase